MKIVVHDYCGHPFQFDLSKELAKRGNEVHHIYTQASGGPKAGFAINGIENLHVENIYIQDIKKMNLIYRWFQESSYGTKAVKLISEINPEVVISSNTPLAAQKKLVKWSNKNNCAFVFWLQDIISVAAKSILSKKLGLFGKLMSSYLRKIEKRALTMSNHIISIADEFKPIIFGMGVKNENVTIIPNWSPIEDMPVYPKINSFSRKYHLENKFVVLYSGTLMMKHNPEIIIQAAQKLKDENDILFVVISGEIGLRILEKGKKACSLNNLLLLPYQPFELLPKALASADIILTILENSAGVFSVPSKVWSGYCSQRPSVLVVPKDNLSAKITKRINAGVIIGDGEYEELHETIIDLKNNPGLRSKMGKNAREYAEKNFSIVDIANRFEEIFKTISSSDYL